MRWLEKEPSADALQRVASDSQALTAISGQADMAEPRKRRRS
jgi:hypothetical protein